MDTGSQDGEDRTSNGLEQVSNADLLRLTTKVVAAYASGNSLSATELPTVIQSVHESLGDLNEKSNGVNAKPAVPIEKSVEANFIICLEDGRKLKMLKRHLRATYDMTPEEYRAKWGLPSNYPMVAPNYAKQRANFARNMGLGRLVRKGNPKNGLKNGQA